MKSRSIQYRIYFRTLRFVAYQWAFPLFLGITIGVLINTWDLTQVSYAIEDAIAEACLP